MRLFVAIVLGLVGACVAMVIALAWGISVWVPMTAGFIAAFIGSVVVKPDQES